MPLLIGYLLYLGAAMFSPGLVEVTEEPQRSFHHCHSILERGNNLLQAHFSSVVDLTVPLTVSKVSLQMDHLGLFKYFSKLK
jgi:hypothetical protein